MSADLVAVLERIAASLERIEAALAQPRPRAVAPAARGAGPGVAPGAMGGASSGAGGVVEGELATDDDLDGKYGDPEVRRDPPRWAGPSFAGRRYSETSPEFLECIAGFLDWAAGQAESKGEVTTSGQPRAPYLRRDAARARGWRARMLAGGGGHVGGRTPQPPRYEPVRHAAPTPTPPAGEAAVDEDDIPF